MKWKQRGRLALDIISAALFACLGAYWVFYAGRADGRGEDWIWQLLLGLLCLAMAGWDLVNVVRGLQARRREQQAEDDPQQP